MRLAEGTADLELFADGEGFLRTHNLEFPDAAALASLQGDEVGDEAEIGIELTIDELGEFFLCVFHRPAIEVGGLLIEVGEHL